jgi:hypothetical protein
MRTIVNAEYLLHLLIPSLDKHYFHCVALNGGILLISVVLPLVHPIPWIFRLGQADTSSPV